MSFSAIADLRKKRLITSSKGYDVADSEIWLVDYVIDSSSGPDVVAASKSLDHHVSGSPKRWCTRRHKRFFAGRGSSLGSPGYGSRSWVVLARSGGRDVLRVSDPRQSSLLQCAYISAKQVSHRQGGRNTWTDKRSILFGQNAGRNGCE